MTPSLTVEKVKSARKPLFKVNLALLFFWNVVCDFYFEIFFTILFKSLGL